LPVLGAIVAKNSGKNELPWLNQALRRDPLNARAELLLAESLAARGARTQALEILRRCANHEPNLANVVAERATHYARKLEELELVVPEGETGVAMLNALAMYQNKPETRTLHDALLSLALERQRNSPATHGLFVDDLLRDLENPNGPCIGGATSRCESQLRAHAAVIEQQGPHSLQAALVHSRMLVHDGKIDEAAKWLEQQCREFASDSSCAAQWVAVASRAQSPQPLEEAASTYLALACSTPDACANAATWIGNLFMARGNYELALTRYERAALEAPSTDSWLRVADAAIRSDHVNRAQSALMSAHRLGGTVDPNLEQRIEQARRELLLRGALKH
jgi:lipopolysaccharide biosynthesis regulator YciM